jgi:hypothetical protein
MYGNWVESKLFNPKDCTIKTAEVFSIVTAYAFSAKTAVLLISMVN